MKIRINIKAFKKNNLLTIIGVVLGAISGYLYWLMVGCSSGSCPITSNPYNSLIYGSLMGGLLFNIFKTEKSKK